jgi:hypothetical protein
MMLKTPLSINVEDISVSAAIPFGWMGERGGRME